MPTFGAHPGEDPLGIAVQGRAQQSRQQYNQNEGWGHPSFGPLPDPKWAGLFQAMGEQGVEGVAGGNAPRGSNAFVGQQHLSGKNGAGEIGPQGFPTATGQRHMLPGYGAPDERNTSPAMSGLHSAFRPQGRR